MSKVIKVPHSERGEFAAFLFAVVDENDLDRKADVKSANGGYEISDRLWDLLHPSVTVVKLTDVYTEAEIAEAAAPHAGSFVETRITEADLDAHAENFAPAAILTPDYVEGASASVNVDRETIRIWAKENGFEVADKGQLKKAVIAAYDDAHSTL